jgi:hypothetical protein
MSSLHVSRFEARYHVADSASLRRAKSVGRALMDEELETALAPFDRGDELILVRRLHLPLRLRSGQTDRQAALDWGNAIARELDRLLRGGSVRDVLRFPSRFAACIAFAQDAVADNAVRDWGWKQMGLLPRRGEAGPAERYEALLNLMAREPETIVPILRALAATATIASFIVKLRADLPEALVRTVIRAAMGGDASDFPPVRTEAEISKPRVESAPTGELAVSLLNVLRRERNAERRLWLARLSVLVVEPYQIRRSAEEREERTRAWLAAARGSLVTAAVETLDCDEPASETTGEVGAFEPINRTDGAPPMAGARREWSVEAIGMLAANESSPVSGSEERPQALAADAPEREPLSGCTEYGGLLFLVPFLAEWGILAALEDAEVWAEIPLPRALHGLVRALVPVSPKDPAALAFCGILPGREPPGIPLNPEQEAVLDACRRRIVECLNERLPFWAGPGIVEQVARREAVIVADPGWFEVRLRLADVSVDLRRAALDLDPGYIPWLGMVLRFVYA